MIKKRIPLFLSLLLIGSAKAQITTGGADISFWQDSVVPSEIHVAVQTLAYYSPTLTVTFGDTDVTVPLTGTFASGDSGSSDFIFEGSFIFPPTYMDSTVKINTLVGADFYNVWIKNGGGDPYNFVTLELTAMVNLQALKNSTGYSPPTLNAPLYTGVDTIDRTLIYDPLLRNYNGDSTVVFVTAPYIGMPNEIYRCPDTSLVCNDTTGVIDWDKPCGEGLFIITYNISQYRGDTFVSTVMRDIIFYITDTIVNTTGISGIFPNSISISPNPTNDYLYINLSYTNFSISISDMTGQTWPAVLSGNEIDVSALPAGVYCLRLQIADGSVVRKFVKE